jgi:ppGpp synthetase/RelA/SpoT-type nucleotidyltranferase
MSEGRSIEDRLREQYFKILPLMERSKAHVEALILNFLLPYRDEQLSFERIEVRSRLKACESAVAALRIRQEGAVFDLERCNDYSLLELHDLVGFRILAFPKGLVEKINEGFTASYTDWKPDHEYLDNEKGLLFMYKYHGTVEKAGDIPIEVQVMPMLAGLFSDVEHDALYKPKEDYKGVSRSLEMRRLRSEVLNTLDAFETAFERHVFPPKQ